MSGSVRGSAAAVLLATGIALGATACAATAEPQEVPSVTDAPSASSSDQDLARFERVAASVVEQQDAPHGMDFVRALEAAGWTRSDLQVTADRTSVGLKVPAVQFAARTDDACLIGQYGDAGLQVLRADPVDGACLIGETRRLD